MQEQCRSLFLMGMFLREQVCVCVCVCVCVWVSVLSLCLSVCLIKATWSPLAHFWSGVCVSKSSLGLLTLQPPPRCDTSWSQLKLQDIVKQAVIDNLWFSDWTAFFPPLKFTPLILVKFSRNILFPEQLSCSSVERVRLSRVTVSLLK